MGKTGPYTPPGTGAAARPHVPITPQPGDLPPSDGTPDKDDPYAHHGKMRRDRAIPCAPALMAT
ncbi:MAG: hypothetical protein LBQ67_03770 [Treponema sp.]|nr:hypothetical protein [Treponema sp.]